jgi:hypothetical protein
MALALSVLLDTVTASILFSFLIQCLKSGGEGNSVECNRCRIKVGNQKHKSVHR